MQKKPKRKPTALRPERGKRTRRRPSALRPGPVRDPAYLLWIRRTLWCWVCQYVTGSEAGSPAPHRIEAAHTGPHGISQKASDHTCIPLCRKHHHELDHQIGKAFWKKYGLNRLKIIAALRAQYVAEKGR